MSIFRPISAILGGALVVGAVALPLSAQGRAARSGEEAAVRAVVQRYVDAREAQDPTDIQPLLTDQADQLVSDGVWRRGREELVRGMLQSSQRNRSRRTIEVETVRFVAPTVALVDGRYRQMGLNGGANRDLWTTLLLVREGKTWRITAIRNMLPAPPAAPAPRPETPKSG